MDKDHFCYEPLKIKEHRGKHDKLYLLSFVGQQFSNLKYIVN